MELFVKFLVAYIPKDIPLVRLLSLFPQYLVLKAPETTLFITFVTFLEGGEKRKKERVGEKREQGGEEDREGEEGGGKAETREEDTCHNVYEIFFAQISKKFIHQQSCHQRFTTTQPMWVIYYSEQKKSGIRNFLENSC